MGKGYERPRGRGRVKGRAVPAGHRSRTRAEKPYLIEDPALSQRILDQQLSKMGLYAANILGDGNCLFRAISDQLYGDPTHHLQLRKEVVDFVSSHPERFRLFVDEDSVPGGFEGHLESMRIPGTYGTHIELSALASLFKRRIKVFQPGLVYIIEADDQTPIRGVDTPDYDEEDDDDDEDAQVARRLRSRSHSAQRSTPDLPSEDTLYIVYHAWEHYSSLRNLAGPHIGLPHIRETLIRSSTPFIPPPNPTPPPPPEPEPEPSELAPPSPVPTPPLPVKRGRGRPRKQPPVHQLLAVRRAHSHSPSDDAPSTPGGSASGSSVSEGDEAYVEGVRSPVLTMREKRLLRDEEKRKKKARAGVLRRSARVGTAAASVVGGEAGLGAVKELYI